MIRSFSVAAIKVLAKPLSLSFPLLLAACLSAGSVQAAEEDWQVVEDSATNKIFLQKNSVQNAGAAVAFVYRIDFSDMQTNAKTGKDYRSVVVKASFLCLSRQMVRSEVNAYAEAGGAGEFRGKYIPSGDEARPFRINPGSSDDRLRAAVCVNNPAPKQ